MPDRLPSLRRTGAMLALPLTLGALAVAAPAAQAAPPNWEPNFGAPTDLGDSDDSTTTLDLPFDVDFPGYGKVEEGDDLVISSNGAIELGGRDFGSSYDEDDAEDFTGGDYPVVAVFNDDLDPSEAGDVFYNDFDDDGDGDADRFVVTWDVGHNDCDEPAACRVRAQVQVRDDSQVLLSYDQVDRRDETDDSSSGDDNILAGVTPGCQARMRGSSDPCAAPEETDFSEAVPFSSGDEPTVYELFADPDDSRGGSTVEEIADFDLTGRTLSFAPNGDGGWNVTAGGAVREEDDDDSDDDDDDAAPAPPVVEQQASQQLPDPLSFTALFGNQRSATVSRTGLFVVPGMTENCAVGPCNVYERGFTAKRGAQASSHVNHKRHGLLARDRDVLAAGQTNAVRMRLGKAANRKLRRTGRLRMEAMVTVTDARGRSQLVRKTITLRTR